MEIKPDILLLQFTIVNASMVGTREGWVLVDTGLENSGDFIMKAAQSRFGEDCPPKAILLTHGHFDHVGSVLSLADHWNVPVYIHPLEMPYVTGQKDYPRPDPTVDEGLIAKMSPAFPHKSIQLGFRAVPLPQDGTVPALPGWRWLYTPGHTEGHVSLFWDSDRVLIAGDALTTTKQESLSSVLTQKEKIKGPPAYLTTDWPAARKSVETLKNLNPDIVVPSHGLPMKGDELTRHLEFLVQHFQEVTVPGQGRFV